MTKLPEVPANFGTIEIQTPEELLKAQEELEAAQRKVDELLAKLQGYTQQLENINLNLSIGGQVKDKIIKGTVDPLFNFGCGNLELPLIQLSLLINLYMLAIKFPTIPAIPDAIKLAIGIKIGIPIELPTVAEFRQYVNKKIEESKKKCQKQAIAKQIADAQEEEVPFTARQDTINNAAKRQKPEPACITTETGRTLDEAVSKAEFKLKRIDKCCECCNNKELKILSSKQENGVFIVTVGILEI
jgi:hypothetical protein